jgi:hypothetical protein
MSFILASVSAFAASIVMLFLMVIKLDLLFFSRYDFFITHAFARAFYRLAFRILRLRLGYCFRVLNCLEILDYKFRCRAS